MQSKKDSLVESLSNTISAMFISWLVQAFLVPLIWPSVQASPSEAVGIVLLFTVIAVGRNYAVRRYFVWKAMKKTERAPATP